MGGKQTKREAGNCTTDRINVSFTETFKVSPFIAVTEICKNGDPFIVKITEVDKYGFRFECLKLNGDPLEKHDVNNYFQWLAISIYE